MPTGKNRNKRTSGLGANNHGNTNGHMNNQKSKQETTAGIPEVPTARQRAKDMDMKRRTDAESNSL